MNIIELAAPHEDNVDAAQLRKDERYEGLVNNCEDAGWPAAYFSVEVGCKGFADHRMKRWLLRLGVSDRKVSKVLTTTKKRLKS